MAEDETPPSRIVQGPSQGEAQPAKVDDGVKH
jgi:hypothetical protein